MSGQLLRSHSVTEYCSITGNTGSEEVRPFPSSKLRERKISIALVGAPLALTCASTHLLILANATGSDHLQF